MQEPIEHRSLRLSQAVTISAQAIGEVIAGRSLTEVLDQLDPHEKPIVQSLTFDALRKWIRSHELIKEFIPKPPPPEVEYLLVVAISLLLAGNADKKGYASHTTVDEAVKACNEYEQTKYAKGLVNAVLRKISLLVQSPKDGILFDPTLNPMFFPVWWQRNLKRNYPLTWQSISIQQAQRSPLTLRVNLRQISRDKYQELLNEVGIQSETIDEIGGVPLEAALCLGTPVPVSSLPGFYGGLASVQDAGAQMAAVLLNPQPGERILDACSAPGGKSAHLLELADIELLALDIDATRLGKIGGNLERMRLNSQLVSIQHGDASKADWWDGRLFDKILLDAPCSASGIVGRHPDIPFLRRESDIKGLQDRQRELLQQAWRMLKPDGLLLYVTCSIFPQEGEDQAIWFEGRHSNVLRLRSPGQITPTGTHDGFYYALFKKNGT